MRAILKAPKILLLDEATSALYAESEKVVQDSLDRVMVDRTTVIVAHRLSTIKGADLIAVVKNGVIAENGNHERLISIKDGVTIIAGGIRGDRGGCHIDGPSEDAKFSSDWSTLVTIFLCHLVAIVFNI